MFGKKLNVGWDVGGFSLKCASLQDSKTVRGLWQGELMPERETLDQSLDRDEFQQRLAAMVKSCQKECSGFSTTVRTMLSGEGTIYRYLELPVLTPKQLDTAVPSQALKFVPFPVKAISLSHIVVPQISTGEKKSAVFFVAVQKKAIEGIQTLMKSCGLDVRHIEVPPLTLARIFARNHPQEADTFTAIVHVGYKLTHVVVVRQGAPYYAREISLAGRDFTYGFQMNAQGTWAEAETHKLNYDLMDRDVAIESFTVRWFDEIKKSIDFFHHQVSGKTASVSQICLSGGTAVWKNLDKRLSEHVNLPVTLDHFQHLKQDAKATPAPNVAMPHETAFTMAVGMGLGT